MYQIFVVEDELLIRQSIRNMIEGLSGPYAFCGEASDGEGAFHDAGSYAGHPADGYQNALSGRL